MLGRIIDVVWFVFVICVLALLGSDHGELILLLLVVYLLLGDGACS